MLMGFLRFICVLIACVVVPTLTWAQDLPAAKPPTFTAQILEDRVDALDGAVDLSDEQKDQIRAFFQTASDRLAEATRQNERRDQYLTAVENTEALQNELEAELKLAQDALAADSAPIAEMIGDDALLELERELITKESDLGAIETRIQGLQESLDILSARQTTAPQELSEARTALSDLQTELNALGDGELEAVSDARRIEQRARAWYRRNQIRALEQEIATLSRRQDILTGRRAVADIRAQLLRRDVATISTRTGQKRVNEAFELRNVIEEEAVTAETGHPVVASFALVNLDFADQITDLAAEAPGISQATASVRGRVVDVENDLSAATKLVEQGRLDREAGATLRRLGNQFQTPDSIRADMRETQNKLSKATRQRIIAQEDLRDLRLGVFDYENALESARRDASDLPDFTTEEKEALSSIIETRGMLLRQISTLSNTQINTVSELQSAQKSLLEKTESLQNLLDENLLWVRSVPAINFAFPRKVGLGALDLFSIKNFRLALTELGHMAQTYAIIVIGFLLIAYLMYRLRPHVQADVDRRAGLVGRVSEDSEWHTPVVIIAGIFHSLYLPLIFLLLAILYGLSNSSDRLIEGLANGFAFLSLFSLLFGSWIRWDREKGLFDAHFKLPADLRRTIWSNLRWFMPVLGTTSFFLAITRNMKSENISEGFAVFVFILTGLAMMIFAARILWAKRDAISHLVEADSFVTRFRGPIALFIVGLPLVTIILAGAGYYESANELLWRMFLTGALILLTYVVFGAIRRAIVVAQRQIKYRQALEKREAELRVRAEKEAAEERGEELPAPPPVDTSAIDVTTMTRQTSQLLRTFIFLGFAVLVWMIWSSLIPALSIFDGITVWDINTGIKDATGTPIERAISLWDIIQSLVILGLTFIAARNLPGFLEIFALNRLGVDHGTRYAVKTVLGYIIVAIGVIIGFNQLGLQWSQLKWIATGLSVGIGFGLQKIIANFISGLIILFERPIRIGDYVTIGDQSGTVSRIQIRATTLKDLDNLEILIPNEALISERVTNWTLSSSVTRLIVKVGVAYGTDTDKAQALMLDAVKSLPKVLSTPPPNVLFMGFGDSSLDFEVRVFLNTFEDRVPMTHVIHTEVNRALEAANISIPFPQRDLNIVSQNIPLEVLEKTKSKAQRHMKPTGIKPKGE